MIPTVVAASMTPPSAPRLCTSPPSRRPCILPPASLPLLPAAQLPFSLQASFRLISTTQLPLPSLRPRIVLKHPPIPLPPPSSATWLSFCYRPFFLPNFGPYRNLPSSPPYFSRANSRPSTSHSCPAARPLSLHSPPCSPPPICPSTPCSSSAESPTHSSQ